MNQKLEQILLRQNLMTALVLFLNSKETRFHYD